MSLSWAFYATDGSPIGITPADVTTRGVGGAELSLIDLTRALAKRGHKVRVFNNPKPPGVYEGVEFLPHTAWAGGEDVFVLFRSPNVRLYEAKGTRIFWSMDQYTIGDYTKDVFPFVDRVVCISPHHMDYHAKTYPFPDQQLGYFDLGVRVGDYAAPPEKVRCRLIYCSVPHRGLIHLRAMWPAILEAVPDATLTITADYRLWGFHANDADARLWWAMQPGVRYAGRLPRADLVREQMMADVQAFPCLYDELFCIASAECQAAGALPLTSDAGSLPTTNQWGVILPGNPTRLPWQTEYVERLAALLNAPEELAQMQARARVGARLRFDWDRIAAQWVRLAQTGEWQ